MKKLLFALIAVLGILPLDAGDFVLVRNHKPQCSIVLPENDNGSGVVGTAVWHFNQTLKTITGTTLPTVRKVNHTANGVTLAVRSIKTERAVVPYEVAMCSVEDGKIKEYLHTFLKVAFTEDNEKAEYANRMGYASPRLSTVIPDLIKFSANRLIVGVNPSAALEVFNKIAKPLRYSFSNDVHVIQPAALKYEGEKRG